MMRRLRPTVARSVVGLRWQSVPPRMPLHNNDSFLSGSAGNYLEELLETYQANPAEVDSSFHPALDAILAGNQDSPAVAQLLRPVSEVKGKSQSAGVEQPLQKSRRLLSMVEAIEDNGHLHAQLDPLTYEGDPVARAPSETVAEALRLESEAFGLKPEDLDKPVAVGFHDGLGGVFNADGAATTLRQLHTKVTDLYTGKIGYEYMHIYDENVLHWMRERIEKSPRAPVNPLAETPSPEIRRRLYKQLADAVEFEQMLKMKFGATKRFGADGGESFIVGMQALIERSTEHGVQEVDIGMAHRGRLNVLHNVCGKPYEAILTEFGKLTLEDVSEEGHQGDVKYHLGMRSTRTLDNGKQCKVELLANPSHLETVNPVLQGYARAEQFRRGDEAGASVLPIEIHGDAAMSGQGVVFETMGLAQIGRFATGGTIHVVVDNQVGFTTDPKDSRSSTHPSDLARVFQCPVLHVNGDSVEDVWRVFRLAADYRREFGRPIVIHYVCYRRLGHNEGDDPSNTQPMLYKKIEKFPDVLKVYGDYLTAQKGLPEADMKAMQSESKKSYRAAFKAVEEKQFCYTDFLRRQRSADWVPYLVALEEAKMHETAVPLEKLQPVMDALKTERLPECFRVFKTLEKVLQNRSDSIKTGQNIEWGTAEALALGSLLQEGKHVRISGQDVERATFSQRHAVVHCQDTHVTYTPLQNISATQAPFVVTNSSLSEYGVLGFEIGYGQRNSEALVMWEAQFADFANGAQIIFDQYMSSSQAKWRLPANVVISMPHGTDGNGPEHSSGRIERFLQAANEHEATPEMSVLERHHRVNLEVVFPSTPKQYFHLLRRHMLRNFRRPMVVFFSKAHLRAPNVSSVDELTSGAFEPVLADEHSSLVPSDKVRRVIFCQGQVYFRLHNARKERSIDDIAIVRVEQVAPMPITEINAAVAKYPNAEVMWVQEEPRNMGSWSFVQPHLERAAGKAVKYGGRLPSPAPSTGYMPVHEYENKMINDLALA